MTEDERETARASLEARYQELLQETRQLWASFAAGEIDMRMVARRLHTLAEEQAALADQCQVWAQREDGADAAPQS